jgi:hypothetical protein
VAGLRRFELPVIPARQAGAIGHYATVPEMVAGGRIERPLAMGYKPMLGTNTLPAIDVAARSRLGEIDRLGYRPQLPGLPLCVYPRQQQ